ATRRRRTAASAGAASRRREREGDDGPMIVVLRRFLVLAALMFWLGGFTLYGGVVVPVARRVLDPPTQQAAITRQVTNYLNVAGAVALLPLAWDLAACRDRSAGRRRARWGTWLGLAVTLALLAWVHVRLDAFMEDPTGAAVSDSGFRT